MVVIFTTPKSTGATDELARDELVTEELETEELATEELSTEELETDELDTGVLDGDRLLEEVDTTADERLDDVERTLLEV